MRRFFARNLLFIISLNLLVKPAWIFLIDRTVQNKVGHASYGIYQALFNLGLVFQILLDFGINNYNSTSLAQNPRQLKQLFPAMLSARVVLSVLYLIIVSAIGLLLGYRGWEVGLLVAVLFIQVFNSILQFLRSNVNGLHIFKADGLLSIMDRFLMIVVCGFLLLWPATKNNFQIKWFVWAQIGSYGMAVLVGLLLLKKITNVRLRFSFDARKVWSIILQSLPYALLIFLMSIYTRADMMLVERLSGTNGSEQAGVYAAAYRLLDVGNMFGIMFAGMLLPLFGRLLAKRKSVVPIVQLSVNLLLPVSLIVATIGVFFGSEIMHLLYRHARQEDVAVFTWLMLAFPFFSLSNVYSTLLTANRNLMLLNKIAAFGVVINLGLNFVLIPTWFSVGAAITAFITQTLLAMAFIIFAQRQVQLPLNLRRVASFVLFSLLMLGGGFAVRMLSLQWTAQAGILLAGGLLLLFLFRFVSVRAALQLMSSEA